MPYHTNSKMNSPKMDKKVVSKKMTLKDAMDKFDKMKNKPDPMMKKEGRII